MNATISLIAWGGAPVGALLGGALGEAIGPRATLLVAAIGELCALLWLWFSPLRALREQPAPVEIRD
jgi:predicted MFS family arabinose efflux permease